LHMVHLGRLRRLVYSMSLVHRRNFDRVARRVLYLCRQRRDRRALLLISGGHIQGQQGAEGIHCHMSLRAPMAFSTVMARPRLTLPQGSMALTETIQHLQQAVIPPGSILRLYCQYRL
jgi:hypothetical protein